MPRITNIEALQQVLDWLDGGPEPDAGGFVAIDALEFVRQIEASGSYTVTMAEVRDLARGA